MKPKQTLVILANDGKARFLRNSGIGKGLTELRTLEAERLVGPEVEFADGPGRSRAAPGMARHAMDPRSGEEERRRELFARQVAETAESLWNRHGFDRLVISAEPKLLGLLRALLPAPMRAHAQVEMDKDLLKVPLRALPKHFEEHILF